MPTRRPKPALRFNYSAKLHRRLNKVLTAIETEEDPTPQRAELADVVVELSREGLQEYFEKPLHRLRLNIVLARSAQVAVAGTQKTVLPVVRNIIIRMDARQLRETAKIIRERMDTGEAA